LKLLLVEDNNLTAIILTNYLSDSFSVHVVRTAEEAIDFVNQNSYSMVLMDIDLGANKNGMDIAIKIKNIDNYKEVPIISASSYAMPVEKEKIMSGGCFIDYLSKPFEKHEIINQIHSVLNLVE